MIVRNTIRAFTITAVAVVLSACSSAPVDHRPDVVPPTNRDFVTREAYPSIAELYGGNAGIYRGCAPNGNVCHNARQYPNMNTLGSLTLNIGHPCNQLQDDATHLDDWCERAGDTVAVAGGSFQLAYIALVSPATDTQGAKWSIVVQGTVPALSMDTDLTITRTRADGGVDTLLSVPAAQLSRDPAHDNAVWVQLDAMDGDREAVFVASGLPGNPTAIQFGDANRNGVYGATLGNALILPGHPERSYIIKRLTDPTAGPLMPLANCCFWTKTALRALWCWIAGLAPDGSNALDPISYGVCPDGPVENVMYPEPGPMCMAAGMCPVRPRGPIPDDPTWANVYANVLSNRCAGGGCHFDSASGGLDMHSSDAAYRSLVQSSPPRVIPGDSSMSLMYRRLTQSCATGRTCLRMPLGLDALPANELSIIDRWIRGGALQNGSFDASVAMDASLDATIDAATDIGVDGPADVAGPDVAADVPVDAPIDAGIDVAIDAAADSGSVDVAADAAVDTGAADVPNDAPDAG